MAHSINTFEAYNSSNICHLDRFWPVWIDSFGNLRKIELGMFNLLDINFLFFQKETDPILFGSPILVREFTTYHVVSDDLHPANDEFQVSPEEIFAQLPLDLKESLESFYYATEPKNVPAIESEKERWHTATTRIYSIRQNVFSAIGG